MMIDISMIQLSRVKLNYPDIIMVSEWYSPQTGWRKQLPGGTKVTDQELYDTFDPIGVEAVIKMCMDAGATLIKLVCPKNGGLDYPVFKTQDLQAQV